MKYILLVLWTFLISTSTFSQSPWSWEELNPLPQPISNNAVAFTLDWNIYSFSGIDTSKTFSGISLDSYRSDLALDVQSEIDSLPDNMGKIAAGASTVKNMIYIIGGYHVFSNGNEVSSAKVHIYNPDLGQYEADGSDIPVPIDDHVQDVWRDSLIYVVTGWSNNSNVNNVQIYNPTTDQWTVGTPTPNTNDYKVFGASGVIIGDTIFYAGGAANWNGSTFPLTDFLRIGIINPNSPDSIEWSTVQDPLALGYRMGASSYGRKPVWFGGALNSYNFDGIAYDGSGGVEPTTRVVSYDPDSGIFHSDTGVLPPIMDLRGVAKVSDFSYVIAGGMTTGQSVSDKIYRIYYYILPSGIDAAENLDRSQVYPTLVDHQKISIEIASQSGKAEIFDVDSKCQLMVHLTQGINEVHLPSIKPGVHFVRVTSGSRQEVFRIVVLN